MRMTETEIDAAVKAAVEALTKIVKDSTIPAGDRVAAAATLREFTYPGAQGEGGD